MLINDGGGGSSNYGEHTQRALLALIGSTTLTNLRATRSMWEDTAQRASTIADLIEERLDALTSDEGGWTGPGAEAFAALIRKDLVKNLRDYALRAAGVSPKGNANTGYAADLKPVEQQVDASYSTASHHNIPWDVDTQWRVDQEVPDQGLLSKVEEVVQGEDEDYEEAKKKAPYMILNGQSATLKKVPQPEWESLEQSITPVDPPSIFTRTSVPVDAKVHRFDRLMEAQQMNSSVKPSVHTAANDVHSSIASYQPQEPEDFAFTGGSLADGKEVTDHTGGTAPAPGGSGPKPGPSTPGGPTTPTPGPETPDPDPTNPHQPGPETGTPHPGPTPGPGGPTPGPGGPTPGPGVPPIDPTDPTYPGDPGPGGYDDPKTGGAGVTGPTAPGAPGPGGIGGPSVGGPAPSPTIGTGPGAAGVGGMGSLGVGAPVAAGARPGMSFQVGANGRPMVNPGSVGPVAGANGASPGSGAGGGAGAGTGAGAGSGTSAAGAPMGRRGQNSDDEEENGEEVDGTWLEEDDSVWGSRAGAPPAEIR